MDVTSIRSFVSLGFGHITTAGALDHMLFLLALAAIYRWNEWRQAIAVITAFTAGHSITLAVAVLQPGVLPAPRIVEFLIPLTILATGVENILTRGVRDQRVHTGRRAVLAGVFGLVHGAGFAGYLKELMADSIAAPLFGFNVGIELGQVLVLSIAFAGLAVIDGALGFALPRAPFRVRVVAISLLVAMMGGIWAVERAPW